MCEGFHMKLETVTTLISLILNFTNIFHLLIAMMIILHALMCSIGGQKFMIIGNQLKTKGVCPFKFITVETFLTLGSYLKINQCCMYCTT